MSGYDKSIYDQLFIKFYFLFNGILIHDFIKTHKLVLLIAIKMNDFVTLEKANNASYYSPFFMKYKLENGMFASLA